MCYDFNQLRGEIMMGRKALHWKHSCAILKRCRALLSEGKRVELDNGCADRKNPW